MSKLKFASEGDVIGIKFHNDAAVEEETNWEWVRSKIRLGSMFAYLNPTFFFSPQHNPLSPSLSSNWRGLLSAVNPRVPKCLLSATASSVFLSSFQQPTHQTFASPVTHSQLPIIFYATSNNQRLGSMMDYLDHRFSLLCIVMAASAKHLRGMPDTGPKIHRFIHGNQCCTIQSRLQSVLRMRSSFVQRNEQRKACVLRRSTDARMT